MAPVDQAGVDRRLGVAVVGHVAPAHHRGTEPVEHAAGFNSYPPNDGAPELRQAIAGFVQRRYGVALDADAQVMALNGTREGLYNVAMALCPETKNGKRPVVLSPNPFYQVYAIGALSVGEKTDETWEICAMTAEGLLCRLYLGWNKERNPQLTDGVNWLVDNHLPDASKTNMYYWYYATQVMHHYGASTRKFIAFAVEWHLNRVAYYRKHFGWWSVLITKPVALYAAATLDALAQRSPERVARLLGDFVARSEGRRERLAEFVAAGDAQILGAAAHAWKGAAAGLGPAAPLVFEGADAATATHRPKRRGADRNRSALRGRDHAPRWRRRTSRWSHPSNHRPQPDLSTLVAVGFEASL